MQLRIPLSIHTRLISSHLLVALGGILLLLLIAGRSVFNASLEETKRSYLNLATGASRDLEQPLAELLSGGGSVDQVQDRLDRRFSHIPGLSYTLFWPDGEPLLGSSPTQPPRVSPETAPEVFQAAAAEAGRGEAIRLGPQGMETLYIAVRIDRADQAEGVLRLEIPVEAALRSARQSLGLLLLTGLIIALGMSIIGYGLARSLAGPIENLTRTAERISQGDLSARVVSPDSPLELKRLAEAFNAMAARLQASLDEMRAFVANSSHELRTPLTSVKLRVEALRSGALEDPPVADRFLSEIESEVDRLSRMVNDLLDLSRIEAGLASGERIPLDVEVVAGEVSEIFKARAERMGVDLNLHVEPGLPPVMANEDQLRRVLYNLVDNAIKYTTRGGKVDLVLQASESRDSVRMQVSDTGFGIAAKHLPHIFERFYRIEATRPRYGPPQGSGLGLPIAKSIVETHGGRISVTSQTGVGTTFVVELPAIKGGVNGSD